MRVLLPFASPLVLVVALALGIAAFSRPPATALAATTTVNIVEPTDNPDDYAFAPATITIGVGDMITWVNNGTEDHGATADNGSFDSGDLATGQSWSRTFTEAGTITYYCVPHPWMVATIVVN